jgi:hypothetical protein
MCKLCAFAGRVDERGLCFYCWARCAARPTSADDSIDQKWNEALVNYWIVDGHFDGLGWRVAFHVHDRGTYQIQMKDAIDGDFSQTPIPWRDFHAFGGDARFADGLHA